MSLLARLFSPAPRTGRPPVQLNGPPGRFRGSDLARPGWYVNAPTHACITCFLSGHKIPNCQHQSKQVRDSKFAAWVPGNYNRLSEDQRAYIRSIGRAPVEIPLEEAQEAGREAGRAECAQVTPLVADRASPVRFISPDAAPRGFLLRNLTKRRHQRKTSQRGGAANGLGHRDPL